MPLSLRMAANVVVALLFVLILFLLPSTAPIYLGPQTGMAILTTIALCNLMQESTRMISMKVLVRYNQPNQSMKRMLIEWALVPVVTTIFLLTLGAILPDLPLHAGLTAFAIGFLLFTAVHGARCAHRNSNMGCIMAEAEKWKKDQAIAQLSMMRSHFNPHFMFNSLNALSGLIMQDQHKACRFVDELSAVMRYVMANKEKDLVSLESEMVFLESYLFLVKVRFREKVIFNLDIPVEVRKKMLPPLLLHMLSEVALRENMATQEQPLIVNIKAQDNVLYFTHNLQVRDKETEPGHEAIERLGARYVFLKTSPPTVSISEQEFNMRLPLISEIQG